MAAIGIIRQALTTNIVELAAQRLKGGTKKHPATFTLIELVLGMQKIR